MNDVLNALVLSLAWFAGLNALLSAFVWLLASARRPGRGGAPGSLLALRLLPAGASMLFVGGVFAPAHWRFEPRGVEESFGLFVHLLAAGGAILLLRSACRAVTALRAGWGLRACEGLPRIPVGGGFEVFEVKGLAGVSLAGVVRPRILVGLAVRETLTRRELEAAVAHEVAHRVSGDNWKRLALYCAPDLLGWTRAARRLEAEWTAATEWQADAAAARGDRGRAADLASALVKVARLGTHAPHSPAWSMLHDEPLLAARVRRLLCATPPPGHGRRWGGFLAAALAASTVAVGFLAAYDVHLLTEALAHALP